jgi:hypothetical protein
MQYKTVPCLYQEEDKWRSRIKYEIGKKRVNKKGKKAESSKEGVM